MKMKYPGFPPGQYENPINGSIKAGQTEINPSCRTVVISKRISQKTKRVDLKRRPVSAVIIFQLTEQVFLVSYQSLRVKTL